MAALEVFDECIKYINHYSINQKGAYISHIRHTTASAPLTLREQEIERVKLGDSTTDISIDSRTANAPGLDFNANKNVTDALSAMKVCHGHHCILFN